VQQKEGFEIEEGRKKSVLSHMIEESVNDDSSPIGLRVY